MKFADRLKFTATGTSATTVTVSASVLGFRTLAQVIIDDTSNPLGFKVGDQAPFTIEDSQGNWELSLFTITSATVLTRVSILDSSVGGNTAATFTGATLNVFNTLPASFVAKILISDPVDISFSSVIPLTTPGNNFMAAKTVDSALTLTPAANAVRGALVYLRMISDGVNAPNYSAFKEWGGSMGYDNRNGIENQMQFFFDGSNYWVSISQATNATPVAVSASALTLIGPTTSTAGTASTAFTVSLSPAGGTITGSVVVTPTAVTGITFSPTTLTLSSSVPTGTFTATSSTAGSKTIAVTNNAGLTNPSSLTLTVAAASTVPAAPTIGTAVAGDGYVDVAFTRNSNGGSAILDSTATLSTGQTGTGSTSPIRVTAPNGTAVTATVKDRNSVGSSGASGASNSVTPVAAAPSVPGAPSLTATGGDTTASITITAGSGGTPTGFTIVSNPAGGVDASAGTTTSPRTITGLTNGTAYTFTATATNATGTSAASVASNSVTPAVSAGPVAASMTLLNKATGSGAGPYTADGSTFQGTIPGPGGVLTTHRAAGQDGYLSVVLGGYTAFSEVILGVTTASTLQMFGSLPYGLYSQYGNSLYKAMSNGVITANGAQIAPANGDIMRARISGTTLIMEVARSASPTAFTTIHTYTGVTTGILYFQPMVASGASVSNLLALGLV